MKKSTLKGCIKIARPKQWIKNLFVLFPLLYTGLFLNPDKIRQALWGVGAFCLASSLVYVFNDIIDLKQDKIHPVKSKKRPLASGQILPHHAFVMMVIIVVALVVTLTLQPWCTPPIAAYLFVNVLYSLWLKNVVILDIFLVSSGFLLRVWAGALSLEVVLSNWMATTTFFLALYLASIKRRQEILTQNKGNNTRRVLEYYSPVLIDKIASMSSVCCIVFYSLFIILENKHLLLTIPLVFFGICRYWYLVEMKAEGESPTDLVVSDPTLICTTIIWMTYSAIVVGKIAL